MHHQQYCTYHPESVIMQRALLIHDRLLPSEKEALNPQLTLEELGEATAALSNAKCPGPDGIPVKIYKAHWHTVGPLTLQCIAGGGGGLMRNTSRKNSPEELSCSLRRRETNAT